MKVAIRIFLILLLSSPCLKAQELKNTSDENRVEPDVMVMKAAADHSKTGEIGVFVIAGTEFENVTDEQLNQAFDKLIKKYDKNIGIELKIQRTAKRKGSTYDFFVDGAGIGKTVLFKDVGLVIKEAISTYKRNRSVKKDN